VARRLAELTLEDAGCSAEQRISFAFRRATARTPHTAELDVLARGLERYRHAFGTDHASAAQLIHHGESPLRLRTNATELAAYTALAGVILNLDETITLE
jgi:hypothetical protein